MSNNVSVVMLRYFMYHFLILIFLSKLIFLWFPLHSLKYLIIGIMYILIDADIRCVHLYCMNLQKPLVCQNPGIPTVLLSVRSYASSCMCNCFATLYILRRERRSHCLLSNNKKHVIWFTLCFFAICSWY